MVKHPMLPFGLAGSILCDTWPLPSYKSSQPTLEGHFERRRFGAESALAAAGRFKLPPGECCTSAALASAPCPAFLPGERLSALAFASGLGSRARRPFATSAACCRIVSDLQPQTAKLRAAQRSPPPVHQTGRGRDTRPRSLGPTTQLANYIVTRRG